MEFSYSSRTHELGYSDGGDHVPSDEQLWTEFVNHPLVLAEIGEDECPTLYGNFQRRGGRFCRELKRPYHRDCIKHGGGHTPPQQLEWIEAQFADE